MIDFIYIFIFVLLHLLAVLVFFYAGKRRLMFFSPVFLFVVYHSFFSAPSGVQVYLETNDIRPLFVPAFFVVFFTMGGVVTGASLSRYVNDSRVISSSVTPSEGILLNLFVIFGVAGVVVYYALSGIVPLAELFDGSGGMHEARRAITYAHRDGDVKYFGQGYLKVLFSTLLPLGVGGLAVNHYIRFGKWGRYSIYMFAVVMVQSLSGQIWPAMLCSVLFVFIFLCAKTYSSGSTTTSVYKIGGNLFLIFFALIAVFFAFRWLQSMGGREFSSGIFQSAFDRLFFVRHAWLYVIFPDDEPFRWGATWLNDLSGFLPGAKEMFAYEVHHIVNGGGWGFTMYPSIFASVYVNFGWFLGCVWVFFLGVLLQAVYLFLIHKSRGPLLFVLMVYFSVYEMYSAKADITSIVYPLLVVFLLGLMAKMLEFFLYSTGVVKESGDVW